VREGEKLRFEVTLTTDEYAALRKVPGGSAQQRLRNLVKFWMAVCDEKTARDAVKARAELTKESPWNGVEHVVDMTNHEVQAIVGLDEYGRPVKTVGTAGMELQAATDAPALVVVE
jgi:hypothetical protein